MKIGIVTDTHSRLATIAKVLEQLREHRVECIVHCGDIEDVEAVRAFRSCPTHFVLGNCDYDPEGLRQEITATGAFFHDRFGALEILGRKIAWLHGDDRALFRKVEKSDKYDFLFYGHSHRAEQHQSGRTLVVNPGALHRATIKSFVVLDLPEGELETITVA